MTRISNLIFPGILVLCFHCAPPEQVEKDFLVSFEKLDAVNPVLEPGDHQFLCPILQDTVAWEAKDVFNPAVVVRHDTLFMIFRAEDTVGRYAGTSRLGLAFSTDGSHFTKESRPVLYPDNDPFKVYEWEGGIEDPRIVSHPEGGYVMTYTAYDGKLARLMIATSPDLRRWKKHGPALPDAVDRWSKSGAIVCRQEGDSFVATKIHDQFVMYFGDTDLFLATSNDLIHWKPLTDGSGKWLSVLRPRPGFFDSRLVEPGPFALLRKSGILLIYNSMNLPGQDSNRSTDYAPDSYSAGEVLFESFAPEKILLRMDKPILTPDKPYELAGQVNKVVFVEGMAWYRNSWLLYYGTADSKIAVARRAGP